MMNDLDRSLLLIWVGILSALAIGALAPYLPEIPYLTTYTMNVLLANVFVCLSLVRFIGIKFRLFFKNILPGWIVYYLGFLYFGYNWFTHPLLGAMIPSCVFGIAIPHEYMIKFRSFKKKRIPVPVIVKK